jgi:Flp pilus assembly protein TadD
MASSSKMTEARKASEGRDFATAATILREILEETPEDIQALDMLGYVLYFMGRPADAETVCLKTLKLSPDHPYALKGLGLCLAKRGAIDEAVASIEKAIVLRPTWFDPRWDLAVTLVEAGRWLNAIAVVDCARKALPDRAKDWDRMERHARASGAKAR